MQPFSPINVKSQQSIPESWEYKANVWYRQMYSAVRRIETGKLKQQHQEMLRVCGQKEENMSLKLFESVAFLVLCWSLADHNLNVIEIAVLIPEKKSVEKNLNNYSKGIFFCHKVTFCIQCAPPKMHQKMDKERPWSARQSWSSSCYNHCPSQGQLYHKPTQYLKALRSHKLHLEGDGRLNEFSISRINNRQHRTFVTNSRAKCCCVNFCCSGSKHSLRI